MIHVPVSWVRVTLPVSVHLRTTQNQPLLLLAANQEAVYENSRLSQRFLLSDSPSSLLGYMAHCDEHLWNLFSHLESSVREGTNQQAKVSAQTNTTNDLFQVERGYTSIISISRYETRNRVSCILLCGGVCVCTRGCMRKCLCTRMNHDKYILHFAAGKRGRKYEKTHKLISIWIVLFGQWKNCIWAAEIIVG